MASVSQLENHGKAADRHLIRTAIHGGHNAIFYGWRGQPKMSFKAIAVIVLASSFAVSATASPLEDEAE
jgi:hypothetical protein